MRKLVFIGLVVVVGTTPAFGFRGAVTKRGDLDADGTDETVRSARVDEPDVATEFDPTQVRVSDTCGMTPIDRRIAGPQDYLVTLKLRAIDTRPGLEVFVDMRSGASARQGETRVVAWRIHSGTPCRRARDLFKYRSTHPTHRPRGTTGEVSGFSVKVAERAARYRGREVVLSEFFLRRGEPFCCGSVKKTTYWRYSRGRDRYVRYRTKIKRRHTS